MTHTKYMVPDSNVSGRRYEGQYIVLTVSKKHGGERRTPDRLLQAPSSKRLLPCEPDDHRFEDERMNTEHRVYAT